MPDQTEKSLESKSSRELRIIDLVRPRRYRLKSLHDQISFELLARNDVYAELHRIQTPEGAKIDHHSATSRLIEDCCHRKET